MDFKGKFFCSRLERGASVCGEQCAQCVKRQGTPEQPVNGNDNGAAIEQQAKSKVTELKAVQSAPEPTGPEVVGSITIVLLSDGNFKVDGPFEDRILFHGMMSLAMDAERDVAVQRRMQRMMPQHANKGPNYWQRKMQEMKAKFGLAGKQITDEALKS